MTYRRAVFATSLALLIAGCAQSEAEKQAETNAKNNAEINLYNIVGIMEYCAGKGYLDRKLIEKTKQDFSSDIDAETLELAKQAYQKGRTGNLLLRMNRKPKEGEAGDTAEEPAGARIDVVFTGNEQRNGELSVFCKRTELWAAREAAAARRVGSEQKTEKKDEEKKLPEAVRARAQTSSPSNYETPPSNHEGSGSTFTNELIVRDDR